MISCLPNISLGRSKFLTFLKHALKCDYLLENFNLLQTGDDAENNDVIAEDESDTIFGHDISKPVWSRDFDFSYGDKEKLTYYCEIVKTQLLEVKSAPKAAKKTPKRATK